MILLDDKNSIYLHVRVRARAVYVVVECYSYRFVTVWENVLKEPKLKPLLTQRSPLRRRLGLLSVVFLPSKEMWVSLNMDVYGKF
jgi:hypothetical protein